MKKGLMWDEQDVLDDIHDQHSYLPQDNKKPPLFYKGGANAIPVLLVRV
jgi:hypothetical protein